MFLEVFGGWSLLLHASSVLGPYAHLPAVSVESCWAMSLAFIWFVPTVVLK